MHAELAAFDENTFFCLKTIGFPCGQTGAVQEVWFREQL
jgi:hypothetical protein